MVAANTQTRVSATQPVMMVKGSNTPVQVSSAEFYLDADGIMRLRTPAEEPSSAPSAGRRLLGLGDDAPAAAPAAGAPAVARVSSADFSISDGILVAKTADTSPSGLAALVDGSSAQNEPGRRRLLQTTSSTTSTAPLTIFAPVCDWASLDLFNASSCSKTLNPEGYQNYRCTNMVNSCSQFRFSSKVGIFMLSNGVASQGASTTGFLNLKPCVPDRARFRALPPQLPRAGS